MALDLGELVARTRVDMAGLDSGLAATQSRLARTGDRLEQTGRVGGKRFGSGVLGTVKSTLIGPLGALLGGAAIFAGFTNMSGLASDFNETLNKSEAIFGKQQRAMLAWSATAATTLGLSKSAALNAAAGFGDMFTQIGFSGKAAAKMSRQVVQASADLGSFSNLDTADVADRIAAAFRGEYDSLQAVIPNINAARVESEALAATHKKSAKELTAAEKATAVLAIVQKDGARAMGDFARTSDGAANKTKIQTARLEDLKTKAGQTLLPLKQVALDGMGTIITKAGPAVDAVGQFFDEMRSGEGTGGRVADQLRDVGTAVQTTAGFLADHKNVVIGVTAAVAALVAVTQLHAAVLAVQGAGGLAAYISQMRVVQTATKTWAAVQWVLNAAMSANPIALVVIAIAALVAGIVIAYKKSETFRDIVKGAFEAVGEAGTWLWDHALRPAFKFIADYWMTVVGILVHGAAKAFGWIPGIGPKLKKAAAEFDKLRDRVDDSLDGIGDEASKYGTEWANGLAAGIRKNGHVPVAAAQGVANKIAAATRAAHDTHSPSRVAEKIGGQWDAGLAKGVSHGASAKAAAAAAKRVTDAAATKLKVTKSQASTKAWITATLLPGLAGSTDKVTSTVAALGKRVQDAMVAAAGPSKSAQTAAISRAGAFMKGIKATTDALARNAKDREALADRIKDANQAVTDSEKEMADDVAAVAGRVRQFGSIMTTPSGDDHPLTGQSIVANLQARFTAIKNYRDRLGDLAKAGLDKSVLRELIDAGPEGGAQYAKALLDDPSIVAAVSTLTQQITNEADTLGADVGKEFHQAGLDSALKLRDGLLSQEAELKGVGTKLGQTVANALRKQVGLAIPSIKKALVGAKEPVVGSLDSAPASVRRQALAATPATRPGVEFSGDIHLAEPVDVDMLMNRAGFALSSRTLGG